MVQRLFTFGLPACGRGGDGGRWSGVRRSDSGPPRLRHFGRLTIASHPRAMTKTITTTKPRTTAPTDPTSAFTCPFLHCCLPEWANSIPPQEPCCIPDGQGVTATAEALKLGSARGRAPGRAEDRNASELGGGSAARRAKRAPRGGEGDPAPDRGDRATARRPVARAGRGERGERDRARGAGGGACADSAGGAHAAAASRTLVLKRQVLRTREPAGPDEATLTRRARRCQVRCGSRTRVRRRAVPGATTGTRRGRS